METLSRRRSTNIAQGIAAAVLLTSLAPAAGSVRAAGAAAFTAHYEHRAQTLAELTAKAQALPPAGRAKGQALAGYVATLNAETTSLFAQDQALTAPGARPLAVSMLAAEVAQDLRDAKAAMAGEVQTLSPGALATAASERRLAALLGSARDAGPRIATEIANAARALRRPAVGRSAAAQSVVVEAAITRLQESSISLLEASIALAGASAAASRAATAAGLAYSAAVVLIPRAGQGLVTDAVGAPPRVLSQGGQLLPDTGTYSLGGPGRLRGVAIDPVTGTLTVGPGAAPGRYLVTYVQDAAKVRVRVTLRR